MCIFDYFALTQAGMAWCQVDVTTISWQAKIGLLLHLRREMARLSPSAVGPATTSSDENLPSIANKQQQKKLQVKSKFILFDA